MAQTSSIIQPSPDQRIRHGAWATVLVVVASDLLQLWTHNPPLVWTELLDLPIVALLAYGLYRRSRVAAIGIIIYFLTVAALQLFVRHRGAPIDPFIILTFFLWRAIPAVFAYHKAKGQPTSAAHVA